MGPWLGPHEVGIDRDGQSICHLPFQMVLDKRQIEKMLTLCKVLFRLVLVLMDGAMTEYVMLGLGELAFNIGLGGLSNTIPAALPRETTFSSKDGISSAHTNTHWPVTRHRL